MVEVDRGVPRGARAKDRHEDEKLRRLGYRIVRVDTALGLRDVNAYSRSATTHKSRKAAPVSENRLSSVALATSEKSQK